MVNKAEIKVIRVNLWEILRDIYLINNLFD